ncbi:cytosine methyltransferase [Streptomyces cellostaticus]|uniref:Cytosine-specific methyltransferase n=1 Tax=Streptomyces cellostaticus TaxID=67285 RepID=A0A101NK83_9ACTN|nr:DNA cytosine methyltransferase [Streptomyces cellostaticus]KUM94579.1 cytosine methyltransferase [Streptomyces cellostaticus]GHI07408.1 cytosine-specific methyltransferase [Streptomyces cellostaticus]
MAKRISMIDLFAGCGGMTSGFVAANGYKPVMAVEWDLHAAATYAANFGESHMRWGDIQDIKDDEIPAADVIIGGPPCQGFSNLGTRDVNDPRNKLWKEYIRFVRHARPKVFVIENVDRFLKSSEFSLLQAEVRHGGLLEGYELTYGLLLAADYGAPQRRKRTIVIGSRIGKIPLPEPTHGQGNPMGLKSWRTVHDAFKGKQLLDVPTVKALPDSSVSFFGEKVPGIYKSEDLHIGRTPTDVSLLRYAHVPPGGGRFDLPEELLPNCWKNKPSGTTDVMGRMRWDEPSLTIRTEFYKPEKGQYLHPQWEPGPNGYRVDRPITHREAALLQTFPDTYLWCGTKIQIAKQIGNAVPAVLAEAIARQIKPYILSA